MEERHGFPKARAAVIAVAAVVAVLLVAACALVALHGNPASWHTGPPLAEQPEANRSAAGESVDTTGLERFSIADVPAYDTSPYAELNGNVPYFDVGNASSASAETYSQLDSLGRCQSAVALVGVDIMPTEPRGSISSVHPTGWHTDQYDWIEGKLLFNRCHLIAFQLSGENDNARNLITGTRYLNATGMLPFENEVGAYVRKTGNHVYYRVTPVFEGDNLVASGVIMEAESFEDAGAGVRFCVWCYNVEPGVEIDYASGESRARGAAAQGADQVQDANGDGQASDETGATQSAQSQARTFVLNTNTMRFHYPDCASVEDMQLGNRRDVAETREALIEQGFKPCGRCCP